MNTKDSKCPHDSGNSWQEFKSPNIKMGGAFVPFAQKEIHPICPFCNHASSDLVKRYGVEIQMGVTTMMPQHNGDWVKWEDHEAALKAKEEEFKTYKENNNSILWNDLLGKRMDQIKSLESQINDKDAEINRLKEYYDVLVGKDVLYIQKLAEEKFREKDAKIEKLEKLVEQAIEYLESADCYICSEDIGDQLNELRK